MTLTTIDSNLTAGNFPTTLTSKGTISSGGGGAAWVYPSGTAVKGDGGTGAGNGGANSANVLNFDATNSTMYGAGGGGGPSGGTATAGFAGLVIVRQTL